MARAWRSARAIHEEGAAERPAVFVRELGEEVKMRRLYGLLVACVRGLNFLFFCSRMDGVLAEHVGCHLVSGGIIAVQGHVHQYIPVCLLAGFGTDAVVVCYQYVFVWYVNPGKEKIAYTPRSRISSDSSAGPRSGHGTSRFCEA